METHFHRPAHRKVLEVGIMGPYLTTTSRGVPAYRQQTKESLTLVKRPKHASNCTILTNHKVSPAPSAAASNSRLLHPATAVYIIVSLLPFHDLHGDGGVAAPQSPASALPPCSLVRQRSQRRRAMPRERSVRDLTR